MSILTKQGLVAFYSAQTLFTTDEKCTMPTSVCIRHQGPSSVVNLASHPSTRPETSPAASSEDSWACGRWQGAGVQCAVLWVMCWHTSPRHTGVCVPVVAVGWVFIQVELNVKTVFIFAIKYAKSQDTQETLTIKWSSKEDFLIDEKTELEMISLLISYIITN